MRITVRIVKHLTRRSTGLRNLARFCGPLQKKRKITESGKLGVGMTLHVKLNVQMPAECPARAILFI